mmetsp:Transcript_27965/g.34743  ORF Transcript_27965/g.34743 Transcript_27965/m.34743 type:complete len:83 (-) Transcript_27965:112-360(-)
MGVERFIGRTKETLRTRNRGTKCEYRVLRQYKFTSERRCSSILIRSPEGHVSVYVKGADSAIKKMLAAGQDEALASLVEKQA